MPYRRVPSPRGMRPLIYRTAYMQRIQDRVRCGYAQYVSGELASARWMALAEKFRSYYAVTRTAKQRASARRRGEASAMLLSHTDPTEESVRWILQVSAGRHPAYELEQLSDASTKAGRVVIPAWGYELVRLDGRWSWRMTSAHEAMWRERIRAAASQRDPEEAAFRASQIVHSLSRVPGFRGIRRQAFTLRGELLAEWRRLRSRADRRLLPPRPWPPIRYVQRVQSQ